MLFVTPFINLLKYLKDTTWRVSFTKCLRFCIIICYQLPLPFYLCKFSHVSRFLAFFKVHGLFFFNCVVGRGGSGSVCVCVFLCICIPKYINSICSICILIIICMYMIWGMNNWYWITSLYMYSTPSILSCL